MSRSPKDIDENKIIELRRDGKTLKQISEATNVSTATLSRRIASLRNEQGILTEYRALQGLQLTELQFRILSTITPQEIEKASLIDRVRAFAMLVKCELAIKTKDPTKIKGLLAYLIEIEKEELTKD